MNERERILDLVKKGVISSEEALVLLENLAKRQGSQQAASPADNTAPEETSETPNTDDEHATSDTDRNEALTELNTEIAEAAGALDAATAQVTTIGKQIDANNEQIIVLDTMEDLEALSPEKYQKRGDLKQENQKLTDQLAELKGQIESLKANLAGLRHQKHDLERKKLGDKILNDDWQKDARDAFSEFGKNLGDATTQLGGFVKDTVNNVLDNVDWKNVTITVPGLATEKFDHVFDFPDSQATILDVKVANGDVKFKTWDQPGIQVAAAIKLYGKMDAASPLDAFKDRSRIDVTDDHFSFQVPNKRVQADLVISLPKRSYDHVAVRLLNGSADLNGITGKDFYVKSTNGQMNFTHVDGVMIESEGVNGSIKVQGGHTHDLLLTTVNGDVSVDADPATAALKTVNGTVRATYHTDFTTLEGTSMNGNVKVAVPSSIALNGEVRTHFGSIKSRLSEVAEPAKGIKRLELTRPGTGSSEMKLNTTSGNIQLKDSND
ncbi:PspC domain-containing protein [Lacticaseibacillus paracasei]|uniref:daptomycin-sensing surface protein LiaX n=1 Tax=Lacticaseibacillus paracasei TaxID=1597 RepID=UPI000FF39BF5|nr:daptomycin-sensing surface protein LiaX [Lacticaseibacillus paracasei]RWZ62412.1 PspC domain-containing protein [Lacticaseibacillus paracasei]